MSRTRYTKVVTPTPNPPVNTGELFYSSTLSPAALAFIDESGNVARVAGLATADYRLIKVTSILQGTVTYTATSGARALFIQAVGGGGGGGGCATAATNSAAAGGGGSGGYSLLWTTAAQKTPWTVQVGAGGAGGVSGANGTAGTDTTFDTGPSICTAKGGSGGIFDTVTATFGPRAAGGVGGLASGGLGDVKAGGNDGGRGLAIAAAQAVSGAGAPSHLGGAPQGIVATATGTAATVYGAGGAGACILSGGANQTGGAGSNGILIIMEFA